ncbi:MAG TPA: HU family DNA-binding protein [Ktedonobacteraceae bacterium]|nr:HU family DNA-binding protein [Ktedonobacteraceae bacterium]
MATLSPEKTHPVVGKDELIHQVAAKAGLTLKETSKVIDAFTEVVREEIAQDHEVRLMGFGTWNLRKVAARKVKSIRGGKQITIPAGKRVGFTVGAVLSQAAFGITAPTKTPAPKTAPATPKALRNGMKKK